MCVCAIVLCDDERERFRNAPSIKEYTQTWGELIALLFKKLGRPMTSLSLASNRQPPPSHKIAKTVREFLV